MSEALCGKGLFIHFITIGISDKGAKQGSVQVSGGEMQGFCDKAKWNLPLTG